MGTFLFSMAGRRSLFSTVLFFGFVVPIGRTETAGLALVPGRLEIQVQPGVQKTVAFQIESPPSDQPVRGRLLLTLTDWNLTEDGSVGFQEAGTSAMSASPWITFSPSAVSIQSGQKYLVRVTIDTPADAKPGVYRAGLFVQERPAATGPKPGEHNVLLRFRYMEVLYVIVQPVEADPKLVDVALQRTGTRLQVVCKMENHGSGFVRPIVSWVLRNGSQDVIQQEKRKEADILLPQARLTQHYPLEALVPGKYELSIQVDFHDDKPVQAMTRIVDIGAESPVETPQANQP